MWLGVQRVQCGGIGLWAMRVCTQTMGRNDTSIRIKRDTWEDLRSLKGPGESFDEVLTELLDERDQEKPAEN